MSRRFLNTGERPGAFNMAFDLMLADMMQQEHGEGGRPVLRFYGWHPQAVSLGMHQDMADFDRAALTRAGIDLVRRPTGGRAILHAHELTYSVVLRADGSSCGPRAIYQDIAEGLLCGLRLLGIEASQTGRDDPFPHLYKDDSSIPCFASSAKSEIHVGGRKLIGSAQRRFGPVVLQHGSLLLGPDHCRITEFLAAHIDPPARLQMEELLRTRTTDAETLLGRTITFDEAAFAMKTGFEQHWKTTLIEDDAMLQDMAIL